LGQPPSSQIETAAAAVEPVCGKYGLGLVMAENQTEQLTHSNTPSNVDIGTSCVIVYVPTGNTGFATALDRQRSEVGAQDLRHLFYEHLSDWSKPRAVEVNRNGKLLGSKAGEPTEGPVRSTATPRISIPTLRRAAAAAGPFRHLAQNRVRCTGRGRRGCGAQRLTTPLPLLWTDSEQEPRAAA
jgi:hypothetical protein